MSYSSLTDALSLLARISSARGDQYRAQAYERAMVFPNDAGVRISVKIREYRATSHIRELDEQLAKPETRSILELDDILGFGPATVRAIVARGITSREQLVGEVKRQHIELTRVQLLGLQHYDDLQRKIPRANVRAIAEIVLAQANRAADIVSSRDHCDLQLRAEIAGSYRRGAGESSDVDIILGACTPCTARTFMHTLHALISARDDFVDFIIVGEQKYSFLMRYGWVVHVDVIFANAESYAPALLYFTGSRRFNIWMREHCKKSGFTLNQDALIKGESRRIPVASEEDIFAAVGLQYVAPHARS